MFDHEYPTSTEWEHESFHDGLTVRVSKVGGGTIGRSYEGYWHYFCATPEGVYTGSDLYTGTAHNHLEAAETVADYFATED